MRRNKILKDTVSLNISTFVVQMFSMFQTFLVMRILVPEFYGLWLSLLLVVSYSAYANLGTENGMAFLLPYDQFRGDSRRREEISDSCFVIWTAWTILFLVGTGIYFTFWHSSSQLPRIAVVVMSGIILCEQQIQFRTTWQTSALRDFSLVSKLNVLKGAISFVLVVSGTYLFREVGLMLATLIVSIVHLGFWWVKSPYRFTHHYTKTTTFELVRIGFPIFLVSFAGKLIETADRLILVLLMGPSSLGMYAVTGLGGGFVYGLIHRAASAMSPHLPETLGSHDNDPRSLEPFLLKPTLVFSCILCCLLMPLTLAIGPVVTHFLPKYAGGIEAFYCFIPGYFFWGVILSANNVLLTIFAQRRQQWINFVILSSAVLIEIVLAFVLIKNGMGIKGAALASTSAYVVYGITVLLFSTKYTISTGRYSFLLNCLAPFLFSSVTTASLIIISKFLIPDRPILVGLFQIFGCLISIGGMLFWLNRKIPLHTQLSSLWWTWKIKRHV